MFSTTRSRLAATGAVVLLLAAAIAATVHSAFTDAVASDGNTFRAGTISLTDDGNATALFDVSGMRPGKKVWRCFTVRYSSTGDIPSTVHLYGKSSGELAPHLNVFLWRGSMPAGGTDEERRNCKGFVPDDIGSFFGGTLANFPQEAANAVRDPKWEWRDGQESTYQVMAYVEDTDAAQGKSATHSFVFEARSK